MRIINPDILRDIEAGKGLRLNLGAGMRSKPGFYNVDLLPLPGVDIVADLNDPLDALPDNCVEEIFSRHTLEHVSQFLPLLAEMHRIEGAAVEAEALWVFRHCDFISAAAVYAVETFLRHFNVKLLFRFSARRSAGFAK